MYFLPNIGITIDSSKQERINKIIPDNSSPYHNTRPVMVYRRDAANKLLAQGFHIISVEKNMKREGDTSVFLFEPANGTTLKALESVLKEIKDEKAERQNKKVQPD